MRSWKIIERDGVPDPQRIREWVDERMRIDPELVRGVLVRFIRDEIGKFGMRRAVIGLSGGVDSSLTCFLAAEALGPENVLAVRMPYRTSSPDSLLHAHLVIEQLGVPSETVEITPMVEPLFERFPDMDARRRGNVMARMRMIILYDLSAAWGGMVVGTSNKTEILLGYFTLYGDGAYALAPLGDLYKNQVRQLARAVGVPEEIIRKPPTADLWLGQTDEGELGVTYDEADRILYLLVEERMMPEQVIRLGFDAETVRRLWRMVRDTQFKRRTPIIAKLTSRTVGIDFRYLRDWGH
jgi:NH(3)-dependent NAD(+) synthetase (EC 6.3.1.5)